ncbi:MAG: glycosyltransferase family 39 protein [Saprospiraceae bacterium]|nr:glycosyltransferase family 39 protein [Saprospiraceae bacterium]
MSKQSSLLIGLAYVGFAIAFRFFSFFPFVIDHDESTYLVIANELLNGQHYWLDIFDTKPIGIFLLYAVFIKIAGHSIFFLRLLTAIWIGITASLIHDIQKQWCPDGPAAWLAGMFYLGMISLFTFYGVSPNTEIYFSSLAILAIWLVFRWPRQWWSFLLAGFSIGVALIIKQAVLFDAIALGLFLLWRIFNKKEKMGRKLLQLGSMTAMSLIPLLMIMLWYIRLDALDVFIDHQFFLPGRYLENAHRSFTWALIPDFFIRYFLITILAVVTVTRLSMKKVPVTAFYLLWLFLALLAALMPKNNFGHYVISMIPALALLAGLVWHPDTVLPGWLSWLKIPRVGYAILGVFLVLNAGLQYKDYVANEDPQHQAYELIQASGIQDPVVYTGTSNFQVLYFLLDIRPPIAYPHPSLIFDDRFRTVLEIDTLKEYRKVVAAQPDFCFFDLTSDPGMFTDLLSESYQVIDTLGKTVVYQRILPD